MRRAAKSARAEPVALAVRGGRAFFAGRFPELEDELSGLQAGGGYEGPSAITRPGRRLRLGDDRAGATRGGVPRVRAL